jgi:hypothetical protein
MISRYNHFILEKNLINLILEAEVAYYEDFKNLLKRMKSPVAQDLLELEFKDLKVTTNFINLGDKDDEVTFYAPNAKIDKYQILDSGNTYTNYVDLFRARGLEGEYYQSLPQFTTGKIEHIFEPSDVINRTGKRIAHFISDSGQHCFISMNGLRAFPVGKPQKSFIGRVARRILEVSGKKYSDKELEDFVNEFKFKISIEKNREQLFELVEGEKIRHFYHMDNYDYTKSGTLHNSCMRYKKCQKYLGIYVTNPEVCKLLVLKSPDNQELIIGRALVWTLDNGDTFMDRIYFSYESDINLFKNYAIKNNWCYKQKQDSNESTTIEWNTTLPDGEKERDGYLAVELKKSYFSDYPYMDTLKYLNEYNNTISTNRYNADLNLESTNGGRGECDNCDNEGRVNCPECDGNERVDCGRCDGDGTLECNDCDGNGEVDCSSCDGYGEVDCSNCDGDGKIDEDGEQVDCPECNGKGKEECSDCDGKGKEECSDCDGRGENECSRCDGEGRLNCDRCDGEGRVDCPECNG